MSWSLALKNCSIQTKLGLHLLPLRELSTSSGLSTEMCFLSDNMGFQGQSWPKFQDFNVGKSVGKISNCLQVSNCVFVSSISLTSSMSLSRLMGVRQKCTLETLLLPLAWASGVGLVAPSSSLSNFDRIMSGLLESNFGVGCP